jgi:hypothetical protein
MNTPVERLIEAVEKGYNKNEVLWSEWKDTLLHAEKEMLRQAFFCGDDSEFHLNIPNIKSFDEYMEYYRACK